MAGLLDFFNTGDPQKDAAISRGLLSAGLQLMQSRGRFLPALSQGGQAGLGGFEQERQRQLQAKRIGLQDELLGGQVAQQKQQAELDKIAGRYIKPAMTGVDATGGQETAVENNTVPASMNLQGLIQGYLSAPGGLQTGLNLQQALKKDTTPIKLGPDEKLLTPGTYQELATNPKKETLPSDVREYQFAKAQGYPGTFEQWDLSRKRAQATNVRIDNKLGEGLAKEVGPMIAESAQAAQGAQQQIANADALIKAVDSNKVFAGPGANIKLKGAQIGQVIGVGGKDAAETISNTRSVIQGLARATTAARAALKGQGSVSDFEGKLLARAESGEIEDMTPAEIKQIAVVNKRLASQLVDRHSKLIEKARGNKATSGVADFFDVPQQSQSLDWGSLPSGR